MKLSLKNINQWKLAVVFSALLPLFAIINNAEAQSNSSQQAIVTIWFVSFVFLMVAWFMNLKDTTPLYGGNTN